MVGGVDPVAETFLTSLRSLDDRIARANAQISSGIKVSTPADAPGSIDQILSLETNINQAGQITQNLGRVSAEVDTAQSVLQSAVKFVDDAITTGAQGASTTTNSVSSRPVLAQSLRHILETLVSLSQTTSEGRYIFSGDADNTPAYQVNYANPNGVNRLITAGATRLVEHPDGTNFGVSLTAQDIFDHRNPDDSLANDNVFAAINSLANALDANDQTGIETALSNLHSASDYLNLKLAFYGQAQNRIDDAVNTAEKNQVQWKVRLSQVRDTDIASAALELQQSQTNREAAINAQAKRPRTSLFDYL
jgi:flagellar hook-associated protein 3 FlgL